MVLTVNACHFCVIFMSNGPLSSKMMFPSFLWRQDGGGREINITGCSKKYSPFPDLLTELFSLNFIVHIKGDLEN